MSLLNRLLAKSTFAENIDDLFLFCGGDFQSRARQRNLTVLQF